RLAGVEPRDRGRDVDRPAHLAFRLALGLRRRRRGKTQQRQRDRDQARRLHDVSSPCVLLSVHHAPAPPGTQQKAMHRRGATSSPMTRSNFELYERIAWAYDLIVLPLEYARYRKLRPQLFRGLAGRILDAGVGTGRNFPFYPPASHVV